MSLQSLLFAVFAIGAVASAIATITRKNPVASAMSLVAHFFMLTGLYLTLEAQFVAAVQVLVYAGAIMVLVVFVIMLLNVGRESQATGGRPLRTTLGALLAVMLVGMVSTVIVSKPTGKEQISGNVLVLFYSSERFPEASGSSQFRTMTPFVTPTSERQGYACGSDTLSWNENKKHWEMVNDTIGLVSYSSETTMAPWDVTMWHAADGSNDSFVNVMQIGTTASIGATLFTTYLFPFEAVSLLLLAALIGALILAKRHVQEG